MRRLWIAILPILLVAFAGPAWAQTPVLDRAAAELRRSSVYVDPGADPQRTLSASAADGLKQRIARGQTPIFVAVLPTAAVDEVGGNPNELPVVLSRKVGLQGTYAVVTGAGFRASSTTVRTAGAIASASIQAQRDAGTEAVLNTFVDRLNEAAQAGSGSGSGARGTDSFAERPSSESGGGGGGGGSALTGLLLLAAIAAVGFFLWSRSKGQQRRQEERKELEADRQLLQAELSVLGSDVVELEPHVTMHPDARADYDAGVTRYRSAQAALEYADDQVDLVRVERVIDEGRYAMDRARARIEGREPPAPPEKLTRPGRHEEPALDLDDRGQPVYVGYGGMPWYGGGWFGGGGSLLTGLLLGGMLGGGWGGWGGHGHVGGDQGGGEGDGGWAGGDVGGGDWGGGDWGGGDFGGDVGGGDW